MRILLCSHWFYPSVGGVEIISQTLAEQWTAAGCEVTVVTQTPKGSEQATVSATFRIVRNPSRTELMKLGRDADIIVQNIISLQTLLPLLACRRPVVVIHNSWLRRGDGKRGWENIAKLVFVRMVHNVSISRAIADGLPVPSDIIGNPFPATEFSGLRDRVRNSDLVFLGRLVSDKGCDTLIEALDLLRRRGLRPSLTVIGDGDEAPALHRMVQNLGMEQQVSFTGALRAGRANIVALHRVMVVPSRWAEPFGVVALEGIASGCAVIASSQGGLPEASGPCGIFFPNGDSAALADCIAAVFNDPALRHRLVEAGPEHLKRFEPEFVANAYLGLFRQWTCGNASARGVS